jgi:hypothetical protein
MTRPTSQRARNFVASKVECGGNREVARRKLKNQRGMAQF